MKIELKQTHKSLFTAAFDILEKNKKIGEIYIQGQNNDPTGRVRITYRTLTYEFRKTLGINDVYIISPYTLYLDNTEVAEVATFNTNVNSITNYQYNKINIMDGLKAEFLEYRFEMGHEGTQRIIYQEEKPIMLIETSQYVFESKYNADIYCKDYEYGLVGIICYIQEYLNYYFKPGEEIKLNKTKINKKTLNPLLLKKYNKDFISNLKMQREG